MARPFSLVLNDPRRAEAFNNRLNSPVFLERSIVTPLSDTYLAGRGTFGLVGCDTLGGTQPYYIANRRTQTAFGTTAFTANTLRAVPFIHDNNHRINGFSFYLSATGAGSNTRVALYDSQSDRAGNLYPHARLWESGAISTAAGSGWANLPADLTLPAGRLYWLATVCSATVPTLYNVPVGAVDHLLGYDTTMLTVAFTYAETPRRFPSGATTSNAAPPALAVLYSNPTGAVVSRTIPCYSPVAAGMALARVRVMRGSDLSKTPSGQPYFVVKAKLRDGTRATTLGTFDTRSLALTQGTPVVVADTETDLPAGSVLEAEVEQVGWPHVSVADTSLQWDLIYKGN